jgi:hypothetical protein
MGNNKSKPTGTIHVRTTPEPIKTAATVGNVADSTMLVLETGRTASDQYTTAVAADANASAGAIVADDATGTSATEDAASKSVSDTPPVPPPAETLPDTSAASTAPALSTVVTEPMAAVAVTKTKMEIATEIFKRLKKVKGITRKEIIDKFVVEAKLSKAGASTYYQLIKAKVEEK